MTFQVSPGVNVSEIDLTTIVPSYSTTDGALAGPCAWGPIDEVTLIEDENQLVKLFGKPNSDTATTFFQAANFLAYGNKLRFVRIAGTATEANNANSENHALVLIKNDTDYANQDGSFDVLLGSWAARHAGTYGNKLKVAVCPSAEAFEHEVADGTLTFKVNTVGTALTGTGTSFLANLAVGSYVVAPSGERHKVASVTSSTAAVLEEEFSTDLVDSALVARWEYADAFGLPPGTSAFAANVSSETDELHIAVVDSDGHVSGTKNYVLEKYAFVSKCGNAKDESGNTSFYKEVVNRKSAYVRFLAYPTSGSTNWGSTSTGTTFAALPLPLVDVLSGGDNGSDPIAGDFIRGFTLFQNSENIDVSLVIFSHETESLAQVVDLFIIGNLCEYRKDCIAILSPPKSAVVNNATHEATECIAFRNSLPSSSYATLDSGWKYQYDKYNDVYRWVPLCGDTAGLCVRTDIEKDPWWSPAGFNRGNIKNVVKLAWNPQKSERDDLYLNSVNPVVTFPGLGTVLYGDKTLLDRPSAFDRINVRRLFIVLEKSISTAAKYTLFEFNDAFTRSQFKNLVEPYLRDVKGRRGIYEFRVVCDATNNTPEVIDRNEFVGDIYIKPARSINFIQLNFVAVRTGVDFNEIVGLV